MKLRIVVALLLLAACADPLRVTAQPLVTANPIPPALTPGDREALAIQHFPSKPTSVAVDGYLLRANVSGGYDNPTISSGLGAIFADRAAKELVGTNEMWAVSPYAADFFDPDTHECSDEVTLALRWKPNGVDCATDPDECPWTFSRFGGEACDADKGEDHTSFVYATTTNAPQGIDSKVMNYYGVRGQLPVRWQEIKQDWRLSSASGPVGPGGADFNKKWRVYFYKSGLAWPHVSCTIDTTTNPNSSLPDPASCVGN